MRLAAIGSLIAIALAVGIAAQASAQPYPDAPYVPHHGYYGFGLPGVYGFASSVWVTRNRPSDPWRCHVVAGGRVYFSSARLESLARAALRPYGPGPILCRGKFRVTLAP